MIYIAGPFFNEEQLSLIKDIEESCEIAGVDYYSPRSEGVLKDMTPSQRKDRMQYIYDQNVNNIKTCSDMIAVTDDYDNGTIFEMGYAAALGKRIVTITNKNYGANVMLSHACFAHVEDAVEAVRCLSGLPYSGFTPETVT
jgi:nucleoside 2-deoxyribosyltransferase